MPLTPTPHWLIPRPALQDGANIESTVNPSVNRIEALFDLAMAGILRVGMSIMWDGATDPPMGTDAIAVFLIRDGRLISTTTYAGYFALIGHAANGGVDPNGGNFRIPDQRGRVSVMMDSTPAMGAANRIPNSNRARFQSGGEERHTLVTNEIPAHAHDLFQPDRSSTDLGNNNTVTHRGTAGGPPTMVSELTGGSGSHNIMQPYTVDNWIVRVK